jgi:hypothetical protein
MAVTVTNIEDYKPHLAIYSEGNAYVIPLSLVDDWANGECVPEPAIMRQIIREWRESLGK